MEQMKNSYEGMFLVDAGQPNTDTALEPVRNVLQRADAEILSLKPWDERRLAYEIEGRKRGLYILGYFKLDADKVAELEHDCLLNENIIRMLLLRKDTVTEAELEAPTPAETAPAEASEKDEEISANEDRDDSQDADAEGSDDTDDDTDDSL
ncbi:MAG: 30S ribosomal protein S6 [Phycisphaerae bacterium]|nr:30S ribosomal protein S6 [Phycisphaerae bacterium]